MFRLCKPLYLYENAPHHLMSFFFPPGTLRYVLPLTDCFYLVVSLSAVPPTIKPRFLTYADLRSGIFRPRNGGDVMPLGLSCVTRLSFYFHLAHMCITGLLILLPDYFGRCRLSRYLGSYSLDTSFIHTFRYPGHTSTRASRPFTIVSSLQYNVYARVISTAMTPFFFCL